MRHAMWGALLWCAAARAAAQGVPVTFEEPQPVTVSGYAVASANYDRVARSNGFSADKIAVSLFKPAGDAYFFGQLTTALEDGATSTEIDHLFVVWQPHTAPQWSFEFGRLLAPIGFERDDEPLNLIPTASFNFEFARPSALTGLIVRYAATPSLGLVAALANGWDVETPINRGKTGFLRLEWTGQPLSVGVTGVYGPEQQGTAAFQRSLVTADFTVQRGRAIVGGEFNLGGERDGAGSSSRWAGGTVTGFLQLGRSLGVSARYDHLDDSKGVLTGVPQVLRSVTVGPMWFHSAGQAGIFSNIEHTTFHLPRIAVRAALRVDYSTQPFFQNDAGGLEQRDTRAVVELIYIF